MEAVEGELLDQCAAPWVIRAGNNQYVALPHPLVALSFRIVGDPFGDDGWGFMAMQKLQDGVQLVADRQCLFLAYRADRVVGKQRQRPVLKLLTGARQSRQIVLVESLGQAIQRKREFDE